MSNTPTHLIYHGGVTKGAKKIWTKIGAVWPNKTGKGSTITWDYVPLADGITVMLPYDKRQDDMQIVPDEYPT
ncbi:MAG: hypothetical protein AAB539_03785 [Patescibacteria group bacterium]